MPKSLNEKIKERIDNDALRQLGTQNDRVDFSSNDYLGLANSANLFYKTHQYLVDHDYLENGSGGSRLLTGNHPLYDVLETYLSQIYACEASLLFNSGYAANLGFFSSVPQRHDLILYDEYSHASIRDGIKLSPAKALKFKHNDLSDLQEKLANFKQEVGECYIVTESVFSMDGDTPDLDGFVKCAEEHRAHLVVDEAHAVGVFGEGLLQQLNLSDRVFARIITFGKALGVHGAAILGTTELKNYLVNFARSFIYTTALTPHTLASIYQAYLALADTSARQKLQENISFFKSEIQRLNLDFIDSSSAIQACIIPGNARSQSIVPINSSPKALILNRFFRPQCLLVKNAFGFVSTILIVKMRLKMCWNYWPNCRKFKL